MTPGAIADTGYTFKPSPYSSHAILVDSLPLKGDGRRVLDVGCAGGYLADIFARRGYEVVGIERVGGCGDSFPEGIELIETDLDADLPPVRGRFSYVICGDILEHLRDPAKLLTQLGEILEPDGALVASLPNSGNLYFRLTILCGRFPQHDKGLFDRTHLHFYMWQGWRELLETAGYLVAGRRVTGVPVGLALPRWSSSAVVRTLEWLAYLVACVWPALFAYQFVVTARRSRL